MNIKSLLLGSAAALIAVSGARAADAVVVAEPEPAEYVKICDVYGAGYFYIPGTETCLKIGGYVRYTASVGSQYNGYDGIWNRDKMTGKWQGTWSKQTKAELNVDTAAETELGTLKSHIGIDAQSGTGLDDTNGFNHTATFFTTKNNTATLGSGYITLGGFMIGYNDSIFASWTNFAGAAINDSFIQYGDDDNTNQVNYTFDFGNGFSAIIGAEEGQHSSDMLDSYMPHVVGGLKYTQGWGTLSGVVAYNAVYEEWAGKLRADIKFNDAFSVFIMGGYGSDDNVLKNDYKPWGGNWAVWGGGTYKFNEKTALYAEASYDEDKEAAASVGIQYVIVPGFWVKPELNYTRAVNAVNIEDGSSVGKKSGWGGVIRFQRDF